MDATTPVLSPFLPGTKVQFAWDSTSLGYLKTCPRLYQYVMIDGWASPGEKVHLRFGQEIHTAFQHYDIDRANGFNHEEALRRTVQLTLVNTWAREEIDGYEGPWTVDETQKAGHYKNRRSLIRVIIDYLDQFQADPAETYILADGRPAVELSFRFALEFGPASESIDQPYLLCGHLDRVTNFMGNLYVMDYKTTMTTPGSYYFDQYAPHNQMTLYSLAGKVLLNTAVKGVTINAIQIMIGGTRVVRGMTYRTPDQLDEWLVDLQFWLRLAESYAAANYWPMNDTACDKFGGCQFRGVCSKSPQVREKFLKTDFKKFPEEERWNPLKPR